MHRTIRPALPFFALAILTTCSPLSAQDTAPGLSIHEALQIAARHIKRNKVLTASMHIRSAVYDASGPSPRWRIIWMTSTPVKGGWIEVHVYPDRSVEVVYGE